MSEQQELAVDLIDVQDPSTELAPVERAALAVKSPAVEAHFVSLVAKHKGITAIKDKAGRDQAHGAAMELMRARTALTKTAKDARDDAQAFSKAVVAEEKRLAAILEPEETRLKSLRDEWDTEQARIKKEAEEREEKRLASIRELLRAIELKPVMAAECATSAGIQRLIDNLEAEKIEGFDEYDVEAAVAKEKSLRALRVVLDGKKAQEAEAARIKAEREAEAKRQAEEAQRVKEEAARQEQERAKLEAERAELEALRAQLDAAKAELQEKPTLTPEMDQLVTALADAGTQLLDAAIEDTQATETTQAEAAPAINEKSEQAPSATSLIQTIAFEYGVTTETACRWLVSRAADFEVWQPKASA